MIEKKINKLKDSLMNVRMSADDKRDVFKRISLVIDKIESISSESHKAPVLSPFSNNNIFEGLSSSRFASNIFVYVRQRKFVPSLVVVLLLCVTGAFSAGAEQALPGDSLYSLKVNVNEQVKGFVAVTPEAKARLAVETTERRLQEAVILSSQGKLTDARNQIIQTQLSKNATDVKNSVATLVATDNIAVAQEVSTNFEASLKTHELILETLAKNSDSSDASNLNTVASTSTATSSDTLSATTTIDSTTSGTSSEIVAGGVTKATTSSETIGTSSKAAIQNTEIIKALPVSTLMQDIRQEINYNTQVRKNLSEKEIAEATDPAKVDSKIKDTEAKYSDLVSQKDTLTDLSPASIKLLNSYIGTASSSLNDAKIALKNNDLIKSVTSLQQAAKSVSDSDSLISIELNSKPEVRRALELIDINKLIDSIHSNDPNSPSNSTSTVSVAPNSTSTGVVLGTSTSSEILTIK